MKNVIAFTILLFFAFGCENNTKEEVKTTEPTAPVEQQESPAEHLNDLKYKGTLPCADCEGIETTIVMNIDTVNYHHTFELKETYLGKPDGENTFSQKGTLAILYSKDSTQLFYRLNAENDNRVLVFRKTGEDELRMMTSDEQEIDSKLNYSLKRF
jgi:uncharacterized lipoprotein NlpE involved in copper resistance